MAASGIQPGHVRQRLVSVLTDEVYGRIREQGRATLLLRPEEDQVEPLRRLVISTANEPVVRLQDIATVHMAGAPVYTISRVDGQPVITLALSRSPGSHMIATSRAVFDRMETLTLPEDVRLLVVDDRSESVREQLRDLVWRGGLGLVLVVFVLLFMLRSVRVTLVVVYSVLVSLSVAFLLLAVFDMTLNLLTLAGLVLVFGLLVDNSVVIIEQLQKSQTPKSKASPEAWTAHVRQALAAVWLPLLGGTLSTMAVLIPLVYLSGELRTLFLPFGILVSVTLGASLLSASVVIPVMMRFVPVNLDPYRPHRRWQIGRWPFQLASRFPGLTVIVLILLLGLPLWLIPDSLQEPEEGWSRPTNRLAGLYNETLGSTGVQNVLDAAEPWLGGILRPFSKAVNFGPSWNYERVPEVLVRLGFPTGNPISRADSLMQQFEQIALASPSVSRTIIHIGEQRAFMRVQFYPDALTTSAPYAVREKLIRRAVLMGGIGVGVFGLLPEGYYSGLGVGSGGSLRVEATGPNYEDLEQLTELMASRMKQASRRVFEVNTNAGQHGRSIEREVFTVGWRSDAVLQTTLSAQEVSSHLRPVLNTRFPFYYADLEGETRVPIRLIVDQADQLDIADLLGYPMAVADSLLVKLSATSSFGIKKVPASIERKNQQYIRYVAIDFRGPHQMASKFLEDQLATIPVPAGYSLEPPAFSFFSEEVTETYTWIILGTMLLVFLITAAVFESWQLPWLVVLSMPMALVGLAIGFLWSGANFAEGAFIGSVLLTGIAVNDSILLLDRYRRLRQRRPSTASSLLIRIAIKDRLRPMWTTTLTSIVAMLPLIVFPDDSDFWMGLAVTVTGGLLASTILAPLMTVACLSQKKRGARLAPIS